MSNLLKVVHLCPQVPTAANVHPLNAIYRLASGKMMVALFPPSSSKVLPNLSSTFCLIILPTLVEPVNDINGILLSSVIFWPTSTPPWTTVNTFGFILFCSRTSLMILAVAIVTIEVVGAPFQIMRSPQIKAMAAFHPKTAQGKLKAVITPTIPTGFQISIIKCSGLSELKIEPLNYRLKDTQLFWTFHMPCHKYQSLLELLPNLQSRSCPFQVKSSSQVLLSSSWRLTRFV